jgi:hypothetical protein
LGYTLFYFSDGTAVSREVMVESQKDHISVPITHSTERLNEEKGDSSRSGSGSNSPKICFLTVGRVRETKKFLILASALYY